MAGTDEMTEDIPAEHVSGACWRENKVAGFFCPSRGIKRLYEAVWKWRQTHVLLPFPAAWALCGADVCVVLTLVSNTERSASCWSRRSPSALEWKPPLSLMSPCQAAGLALSPLCYQWPWFSRFWRAKGAVVQPHQGPHNHLREEAEGHCWTGEGSEGELWPCMFHGPLFLLAILSHLMQPSELHPAPVAPA